MKKLIFIFCILPVVANADENCHTRRDVPRGPLSLEQVVNLGLCRNPTTAAAYLAAESARLSKNAGYAPYLPSINASASMDKPYRNDEWGDWSWGASLSASYLIFDFGKRLSDLNTLASTWRATGFDYDDAIQNYVYGVIGAYYGLLTADANVTTAESLKKVAQTARDTANSKFKAGSVARADVLKADTTLAARDLELERAKNNREIAKGTLLARLSFSADGNIEIMDMPSEFGTKTENKSIDELLRIAQQSRPDLLRATANKDAAWHRRNSSFLRNLPSISATAGISYNDNPSTQYNIGNEHVSGSIGIRASMPIFAGFANLYNVRAMEASYERAMENERATLDSAELDVFTAYNNYKTAQTVLDQSKILLASAKENERVTAGMYRVGRATMLEWQTAQAELADGEKQFNTAKYDLFTKRAAVAMAVGEIRAEVSDEVKEW